MEPNLKLLYEVILGTIYVAAIDVDGYRSLTDEEIESVVFKLKYYSI